MSTKRITRGFGAALLTGLGLGLASPATAEPAGAPEGWIGRYCTRPGCGESGRSPGATAAGFAAVALGAAWWSRRPASGRAPSSSSE